MDTDAGIFMHFLEHNVYPISDLVVQNGSLTNPITVALMSWVGLSLVTIIEVAIIKGINTLYRKQVY